MLLSHKIALDPTYKQCRQFVPAAGCARFTYNWALNKWEEDYRTGKHPNVYEIQKAFYQTKKAEWPWMYQSPKNAGASAVWDLNNGYQKFFKKQARHPKARKKRDGLSFGLANEDIKLDGYKIRLPKIGWVRMFEQLRLIGKIMCATVSKVADHWFVSITVEVNPPGIVKTKQSLVGVDLGLKQTITVSDGTIFQAPKPLGRNLNKLRRLHRSLDRKKLGSKRREKAKILLGRLYAVPYAEHGIKEILMQLRILS